MKNKQLSEETEVYKTPENQNLDYFSTRNKGQIVKIFGNKVN